MPETLSSEAKLLILAHAAATLFLVGLIWTIQIVHYPLFRFVGEPTYTAYQSAHMNAITLLVGPVMLVELFTGFLLFGVPNLPPLPVWIGMGLIGVVWLATACVNVPQHTTLSMGFETGIHQALVASNWIRTLAWTARGALIVWLLWSLMR